MALTDVETRLFIGNEFVPGSEGKTFQLSNPATEEATYTVHEASAADIDAAVQHAKKAQAVWAETDSHQRGEALKALAALIMKPEHIDRFATLESITMGWPKAQYALQPQFSAAWLSYCAVVGLDIRGETNVTTANRIDLTLKQPYGVGAVIIPWNTPLFTAITHIAAALATGNAIIVKSSEKAPLAICYLASLLQQQSPPLFPPGLVQIVSGLGATTGNAIAEHMEIRKLAFVGSVATGKKIKAAAARSNLKNVTCELGGKSPLVVFEDADVEKAAAEAAFSMSFGSGQACIASSRVYVQASIRDKFAEAFKTAFQNNLATAGDPLNSATNAGPLADVLQFKHVMSFLEGAKRDGIKAAVGGGRRGEKGYWVEPTIFFDPPEDHNLVRNEIFGPVVVISTFTSEEDVLFRSNNTEFGLYASVYTSSISRALKFAKKMEAGTVGVNCTSPTVSLTMPFGGWKQSGEGRQGGRAGLEEWLETKTVLVNLV